MEERATYGGAKQSTTITKKKLLIALNNIPDDAVITIAVDDRDYQAVKQQQPNMDTVYLGIPGDHSYDKKGICFLTWPLKDRT